MQHVSRASTFPAFSPPSRAFSLGVYTCLQALDVVTTMVALRTGALHEGNPFIAPMLESHDVWVLPALKTFAVLLTVGTAMLWYDRHVWYRRWLLFINLCMAGIVLHNVWLLVTL